jgi:hypothetical protein
VGRIRTVALALLLATCFLALAGGSAHGHGAAHVAPTAAGLRAPVAATNVGGPTCATRAPTTARGYAHLFAHLPTSQWGAADLSITVALRRRSVWLYGDTFEAHRFAHSTAIVQTRGCLHVSHAGAQLLPNDDPHHIYWITSARAVDATRLAVIARSTVLTGTCLFCFRDGGFDRTALLAVSATGDVSFVRWTAKHVRPAPNSGPMIHIDNQPHHFGYARHAHPEAQLASGRMLVTTCQNWDDGILHQFADYRPIFAELPR